MWNIIKILLNALKNQLGMNDENEKTTKVFHSGSNGGFRTYSFTIPSQNYLVVIFSNRDDIDLETLVQKIVQLQWPSMMQFIKIEKLTS